MRTKRRSLKRIGWIAFGVIVLIVYLTNTPRLADPLPDGPLLVAHRGLGQAYDREGLTGETCTAARLIPGTHPYLENTLPSMRAAFERGADIVEFDVQWAADGEFAVFHDHTLDCRTERTGVTRERTLGELKALDIGYGYTADGGRTFPFRGKGVGMMPSLEEVLAEFPDRDFLIDIKSNDPEVGETLAERLEEASRNRTGEVMVYGGVRPVGAILERLPDTRSITRPRLKRCLGRYIALGWTGYVPPACERGIITVPANVAPWLWGWPDRFLRRMDGADSIVVLLGDYGGESFSTPFDDARQLEELPADYSGGIWTDRIDVIGEAVEERRAASARD